MSKINLLCVGGILCKPTNSGKKIKQYAKEWNVPIFSVSDEWECYMDRLPYLSYKVVNDSLTPTRGNEYEATEGRGERVRYISRLSPCVYNIREINLINGNELECAVNPFNYTSEDINSCIRSHRYEGVSDMFRIYGRYFYRVLCEWLFECYETID